jgi:hypothetical protein
MAYLRCAAAIMLRCTMESVMNASTNLDTLADRFGVIFSAALVAVAPVIAALVASGSM